MPELPEVETVRRGLAPHIEGRRISEVALARPDLRFPFPADFVRRLTGAKISRFGRRGKYLLAEMESRDAPFYWLSHLGMTGRYVLHRPDAAPMAPMALMAPGDDAHALGAPVAAKHIHVRLTLDDGSRLAYADPRRFGFMDLVDGSPETSKFLTGLGPEPLGHAFHLEGLVAACKNRKSAIKNVLLDQRVVAGLGNIYVCEALFLSGISPRRLAANTGSKRLARLIAAIREVLAKAIEAGGSTLRDFAHSDGRLGYFQHSFHVYDREAAVCSRPDCHASIKRIIQSGRSSFYCPSCQK